MPPNPIASIVATSVRARYIVAGVAAVLFAVAVHFVVNHFAITTDTFKLISPDVPWRVRERIFNDAFPQRSDLIVAVVDGPTADATELAAAALAAKISGSHEAIKSVTRPDALPFFKQDGLLFLSQKELEDTTAQLIKAQPFLGTLAEDPSLRGLMRTLVIMGDAITRKDATLAEIYQPLQSLSVPFDDVLAGRPAHFSWRTLLSGKEPGSRDLRKLVLIKPVLDFGALQPGGVATKVIRTAVSDLRLADEGVRVRLTGPVPLADEEFATVADGAALNGVVTVAVVILILWLALRSWRIIGAVLVCLFVGLAITAALGLAMVKALNLISVAFAVLFIGLGVDFGLQFSVRYRQERFRLHDIVAALVSAGREAGAPLALAAAATALGFMSFLPTSYRGLSELGLIAGVGMIVAFVTSVTLLPALLRTFGSPAEPASMGYSSLAAIDHFTARHRTVILVGVAVCVVAGIPGLLKVHFDFNPIDLRSAKVESVSTYLDLLKDPATSPNQIDILAPSLDAANEIAAKVATLPLVDHTMTLTSFVPKDQAAKLETIQDAALLVGPSLHPEAVKPAPDDAAVIDALKTAATSLRSAASVSGEGSEQASHMAGLLERLAAADPAFRAKAASALMPGLVLALAQTSDALTAGPVELADLPAELVRDWQLPDGRSRAQASPKGDLPDNEALRAFTQSVLAVEPDATGTPVSIMESGVTIVHAFFQAGAWALASITLLLFLVLRRPVDVLLTLVPLLLAGVVTLEICGLIDMPLNFANIIALPLLLGVGVAFKVYFVMAWRAGETELLASSLTRAVCYSALTTATAFGSLWFSNHPGTSSMGRLLALSLACTLAAAVLFQPVLMGPPRKKA
jgi:uncharacterized protein